MREQFDPDALARAMREGAISAELSPEAIERINALPDASIEMTLQPVTGEDDIRTAMQLRGECN